MFKHILVPTDDSELSQEAAHCAVRFAKEAGAIITVFYARPEYRSHPRSYASDIATHLADIPTHTPKRHDEVTKAKAHGVLGFVELLCRESGVHCKKLSSVSDDPSKAIIEVAEKNSCDLIFMASHGRKGLNKLLLGSVTQNVLTHSAIPVLVYRPPQ